MFSYVLTLLPFLILNFAVYVNSSCLQGQIVTQVTKYGTRETHCIYNNLKMLPGSSFKLAAPDCLECKCTAKSLSCCGFGFAAGKVAAPPGCVAQNDACKLIFVKENNPSEVCKSGKDATTNKKKPTIRRRT